MPETSEIPADTLIDDLLDGVFVCTRSGDLVFANPAFAQMLRYSREDMLSKSLPRDLVTKDLEWRALASLLDQGSPICDYEIKLRRSDGYEICMAISALNLKGEKGEHTGIAGVARDISTRKAIERELREKAFRADALNRMAAIAATNKDIRSTFPDLASELGKAVAFEGISVGISQEGDRHVEIYVPDRRAGEAKRVATVPYEGSIVSAFTSSRAAIIVEKDAARRGFSELAALDEAHSNSLLAVPLVSRGRILGSVNLIHSVEGKYDKAAAETLQAAADMVAGMIESIDLLTSLEAKLNLLHALLQTGVELQRVISTEQIYPAIASHLREVVPYKDISFYVVDWQTRRITPVFAAGDYTDEIMASPGGLDEGVVGAIAKSGKPEIVDDVDADPRAEEIPGTPPTHESMMGIPLIGSVGVIGVLELYRPQGHIFSGAELEAGMLFAQQASVALENSMLVKELQDARKEVELLNDLMFHDINNYNFATMNYIDVIAKSKDLSPEHREKIGKALHLIKQNARLIDAVKKLTRIGTMDSSEFVPLDLSNILRKVVSGIETAFPGKKLSIRLDVPDSDCYVMAHPLIDELFVNLVSNAVKFDPHNEVEVDVECREVEEDGVQMLRVCVADRGPGIPDESKPKLFEKYSRLKPHDGIHGTGLGLSICKALADKYGGRIWVEDRVTGKCELGARFCVMLPAAHQKGQ